MENQLASRLSNLVKLELHNMENQLASRSSNLVKLELHNVENQFVSRSSNLVKPSIKLAVLHQGHPAFTDGSSDTEYTSASSEEALHINGNSAKSKVINTPQSQDQLNQVPQENLSLVYKSEIKLENLVTPQQGSFLTIPPLQGEVLNGQMVTTPPFSIQRFGSECARMKERYEIDKNGQAIVVVDLGGSDEETEPLLKPLCKTCRECRQDKEHEPQVIKAAEKNEVHAEENEVHAANVTLVVDLSGTSLQVNHSHVGVSTPFPSEVNGKHVAFSKERMNTNTVSVKEKVETKSALSREHVKSATESTFKLHSRIAFGLEVLNAPVERVRETVLPAAAESEDEASTLSEDYKRGHAEGNHAEMTPPDWSPDVLCDLCERGASLTLGPWYSWCCGNPSLSCHCSPDDRQRKKRSLLGKGGKNWKTTGPSYPWSGKVHKLCGLWSAEVFEDSEQPWTIMKLGDAVKRSRKIKCSDPDCGLFGATLGCRVASCRRSFHYPCADRLSALVKVRMWDGLMKPIACTEHRHVNDHLDDVKLQKESKKRKRGKKGLVASSAAGSSKNGVRTSDDADVIRIESSDEEEIPHGATVQDVIHRPKTPNSLDPRVDPRFPFTKSVDTSDSWPRGRNAGPAYFGKNLLCTDFSNGQEYVEVPCTNDVDSEPPPYLEYITQSRYQGQPLGSKNCSHPLLERQAKACNGCALHDPDDPLAPLSVHIPFQRREDDYREDWLRERMYGRLPYDKYARLVIGTDYNELVECNDRCKCGDHCINREMQKGLRTPIELYKTINKGWAVRTLVPIPRGRFVIEYVGEMLTQDQAQRYGQVYDEIKRSYLYDLDYPESKRTPDFTLDGFHASNVARFINHSCDANLKIYRVYVETTYKWLAHIGMYAMRDIEAGEELSYDYNYGRHELQAHDGKSNNPEAVKQKIEQENDSTHIKCYCEAKNCREWLWRPMHSGEDSEEEQEE